MLKLTSKCSRDRKLMMNAITTRHQRLNKSGRLRVEYEPKQHNNPYYLSPQKRMPILSSRNQQHKIASRLSIEGEEKYIDELSAKLEYVPRISEIALESQPLKHKIKIASHKMSKKTKEILLPEANSEYLNNVDKFPDFKSRTNFTMKLPAWDKAGNDVWYSSYMRKAMWQYRKLWDKWDMVVELHDARIPFTGRNPDFYNTLKGKPYVLLFTKLDLTPYEFDYEYQEQIRKRILARFWVGERATFCLFF